MSSSHEPLVTSHSRHLIPHLSSLRVYAFSQFPRCFDELIPVTASGEPLDAEGKMECFFKVFDQRRCRVSRDIEIFPIRIDAKIHRRFVGGTDDTGDAVLLTFIEAFRHGKEEG